MIRGAKIEEKEYYKYADDVISGRRVAGKWVKLACQRFMKDLENPAYVFDMKKFDFVESIFHSVKHFKGRLYGKRFDLTPFEAFIVANLYCFLVKKEEEYTDPETGELRTKRKFIRRFRNAYISVSRKCGKSSMAAMLCLLDLFLEPSAEACLAANTRDQAAICYELAKGFARSLDSTGKHLKVLRKGIEFKDRQSQLKVLSGDVNTLDGLNPSTYVLDEFHAAQTTDMLEVLASGQGQREQPLGIIITTAGLNLDCPCKQYEDQCIEVLKGNLEEETNFIFICGVDEEDDPIRDESCWEKANPNLGITVDKDYLRARVNEAIVHPERETAILTKNFNKWVNSASVWISDSYVEPCFKVNGENYKFNWERFRNQPCWIGCDLSENCDLTAIVFLFYSEQEQRFYACPFYFLPRSAISEASTQLKVYYELMENNGYLIVTDTNDGLVTDYDYITHLILDYIERYNLMLQTIYTDKYNATAWVTSAVKDYNLPIDYFSQTVASFNGPTRQVEFLVKTGRLTMHANPLMLWNFRCVDLTQDRAGNVKPTKKSWKKQKIDGVICLIQAIAAFYNTYAGAPEIFSLTDGD